MSLLQKVFSGVFWVSVSTVILKIINFSVGILLARILYPSDFGLLALALIPINFFEIFRDFGISTAIIHEKKDIDVAASTAFLMMPIIAIFFYTISYLISPYVSVFFNTSSLETIIKVLSLSLIIWSFGNIPKSLLIKQLQFKKLTYFQIIPKIVYGLCSIALALSGFGVWSLVISRLIFEITSLITIWNIVDWHPSLRFNKEIAIKLLKYGKFVLFSSLFMFLISVLDVTLLGKISSPEVLGYYTVALSAVNFFTVQVAEIASQIVFPVFSKIDSKTKIVYAYKNTLYMFSLLIFPAATGLLGISSYFVTVLYGIKWLPMVAILQILCIYGVSRSAINLSSNLFMSLGKPEITSKISFINLVFLFILIVPAAIKLGMIGVGLSVTVSSVFCFYLSLKESSIIIGESLLSLLSLFKHATIGSGLILISIFIMNNYILVQQNDLLKLIFDIFVSILLYVMYIGLTNKDKLSLLVTIR